MSKVMDLVIGKTLKNSEGSFFGFLEEKSHSLKCKHIGEISGHLKSQDVNETDFPSSISDQMSILVTCRGEVVLTELSSGVGIYSQ